MKDELIKILPDLKQAVESGMTYAGDLFNRAVLYYKISGFIWLTVLLAVVIIYLIYVYKTSKWVKTPNEEGYYHNDWEDRMLQLFIGGILALLSVIGLIFCIDSLIQLYIIPEVYIIQMLTI